MAAHVAVLGESLLCNLSALTEGHLLPSALLTKGERAEISLA